MHSYMLDLYHSSGHSSSTVILSTVGPGPISFTVVCLAERQAELVHQSKQECPEPISGPDANNDGLDDCIVPVVTTTTLAGSCGCPRV